MKRLAVIVSCLFLILAGAASAWADCKQTSAAAHTHEHHADASHAHSNSHHAVLHCPTLDEFILTASFSARQDRRVESILATVFAEFYSQSVPDRFRRLTNGPPNCALSGAIPLYLHLSALRI